MEICYNNSMSCVNNYLTLAFIIVNVQSYTFLVNTLLHFAHLQNFPIMHFLQHDKSPNKNLSQYEAMIDDIDCAKKIIVRVLFANFAYLILNGLNILPAITPMQQITNNILLILINLFSLKGFYRAYRPIQFVFKNLHKQEN